MMYKHSLAKRCIATEGLGIEKTDAYSVASYLVNCLINPKSFTSDRGKKINNFIYTNLRKTHKKSEVKAMLKNAPNDPKICDDIVDVILCTFLDNLA